MESRGVKRRKKRAYRAEKRKARREFIDLRLMVLAGLSDNIARLNELNLKYPTSQDFKLPRFRKA